MIYLRVAHTNDDDCDLFKFNDIRQAARFIEQEEIVEYVLQDNLGQNPEFEPEDYTLVNWTEDYGWDIK